MSGEVSAQTIVHGALEQWPVSRLRPYAANARTHSDEQIEQIAASITEFGFTNPILARSDGTIAAGHARLEAAKLLSMEQVPVIVIDGWTEEQFRAYVLADNKLALLAGWDESIIAAELRALAAVDFDIGVIGFSDDEVKLLTGSVNFDPGTQADQGKLDEVEPKWITCPHCGERFDARQAEAQD